MVCQFVFYTCGNAVTLAAGGEPAPYISSAPVSLRTQRHGLQRNNNDCSMLSHLNNLCAFGFHIFFQMGDAS